MGAIYFAISKVLVFNKPLSCLFCVTKLFYYKEILGGGAEMCFSKVR